MISDWILARKQLERKFCEKFVLFKCGRAMFYRSIIKAPPPLETGWPGLPVGPSFMWKKPSNQESNSVVVRALRPNKRILFDMIR